MHNFYITVRLCYVVESLLLFRNIHARFCNCCNKGSSVHHPLCAAGLNKELSSANNLVKLSSCFAISLIYLKEIVGVQVLIPEELLQGWVL